MSAEDRAAVKGGLTDAQFNEILRVIRETVRAEMRAEFEGRFATLGPVMFGFGQPQIGQNRVNALTQYQYAHTNQMGAIGAKKAD